MGQKAEYFSSDATFILWWPKVPHRKKTANLFKQGTTFLTGYLLFTLLMPNMFPKIESYLCVSEG
jgi:hypothetical protein